MIKFIYFLSRMKQTTIVFGESRFFVGWLQEQIQYYPLISATSQLFSKIAWLNIYVQITFTVDSFQFRFRYIQVNCSSAKYDFGTKRRLRKEEFSLSYISYVNNLYFKSKSSCCLFLETFFFIFTGI